MSSLIQNLPEPIAIIGMGLSGTAALNLIRHYSPGKKVFTFDQRQQADYNCLDELFSQHSIKTLVVSPGFPLKTPEIQTALANGAFLTSEISLAFSCLTTEKVVAVTGSIGKSTTTALIEKALQTVDRASLAAGNIGLPLADYVLLVKMGARPQASWIVLELSSYQLENFDNLVADHSIFTFFAPNHLERYSNLQDYYETKWRLSEQTRETIFVNAESPELIRFLKAKNPNPHVRLCSPTDSEIQALDLSSASLLGVHNQQNMSLAAHLALHLQWGAPAIEAIKNFRGLSHRLENLGEKNGIHFVNDSKATALDSVWSAAESLSPSISENAKMWLLIGGKDKNLPWKDLSRLKNIKNLSIIYFGECRDTAKKGIGLEGPQFSKLKEAFDYAVQSAKPNDLVLLSPGGTSHDEFKNFEERGEFFKKLVDQFS